MARILIKNGADVNHRGKDGVHLMYDAAAHGDATYVKFLLEVGANPSMVTDFGWAPLHWAANNGHIGCVRVLLDGGADVNPVSDQAKTPLDMAIQQGWKDIEAMLREKGAMVAQDVFERGGWERWQWWQTCLEKDPVSMKILAILEEAGKEGGLADC